MADEYDAELVDIWSCGLVLVHMLTGELPWEEPLRSSDWGYRKWRENRVEEEPFKRIPRGAFSLLKKMLKHWPDERFTLKEIQNHCWFKKDFTDGDVDIGRARSKRLRYGRTFELESTDYGTENISILTFKHKIALLWSAQENNFLVNFNKLFIISGSPGRGSSATTSLRPPVQEALSCSACSERGRKNC